METGFGIAGSVPGDLIRDLAPELERLGYATLWINDTPGGDSLAGCEAAIAVTSRLRLATGVIPIDRRSPSDIVADIRPRKLPLDRLTIGIGSGQARPALELAETAIADLRHALGSEASIAVAALRSRMTRLAATDGDEVLLNWMTPAGAAVARREIDTVVGETGRQAPRVSLYVRTSVDQAGERRLADEAARYAGYPAYAASFRRFGIDAIETTVRTDERTTLRERLGAYRDTLDEVVVRAVVGEETLGAYLDLAKLAAPRGA